MDDLFAETLRSVPPPVIQGLDCVEGFLDDGEQGRIMARIDAAPWSTELRRRVQHYGYRYDYRARAVSEAMRAEPLPPWAEAVGRRLVRRGLFAALPDQVIVNEYMPGQGIAPHVDCVPCFGDSVASVSFLNPCVMSFTRVRGGGAAVDVDLPPGSAVVLREEARYGWRHGIAARMSDLAGGASRPRARRVSATFRTVLLSG